MKTNLFIPFNSFDVEFAACEIEAYRYGFNGKELDKPGMGGGLSTYDYGFRIYNPAIAKFLSVDPLTKEYPWYTPYQFAGNKPIWAIDLDGLEELIVTNFYNVVGQLYKTEIQVTNGNQIDGVQNTNQVVHYNRVQYNGVGDAMVTYQGTVTGTRAAGAGSTAIPAEINQVLWSNQTVGGTRTDIAFGIGNDGKSVEQTRSIGPAVAPAGSTPLITDQISVNGIISIDWTNNTSSSGLLPGVPSPFLAGTGIAAPAAVPANNAIAFLPEGVNSTPNNIANLMQLPAAISNGFGIQNAFGPFNRTIAQFNAVNNNPNGPNTNSFSRGTTTDTLNGGNGANVNYQTTSQSNVDNSPSSSNSQVPANNPPGTATFTVTSN